MGKAFYETSMFLEPFRKKNRSHGGSTYRKKTLSVLKGLIRTIKEHYPISVTSSSVIGECHLILRDKEKRKRYNLETQEIIANHDEILKDFEIVGIPKEALEIANEILNQDPRLGVADVLNFSCAIAHRCNAFFFIDEELKTNQFIKKKAKEHDIALVAFDTKANED